MPSKKKKTDKYQSGCRKLDQGKVENMLAIVGKGKDIKLRCWVCGGDGRQGIHTHTCGDREIMMSEEGHQVFVQEHKRSNF